MDLGRFYVSAGYVLLVPHRTGHGQSPGEYFIERLGPELLTAPRDRAIRAVIEFHERQLRDTLAAFEWLRKQPFVDGDRVSMSGVSHGGIQVLLAAEAGTAAKAFVPFAPGATGWDGNPELQERLALAVERASAPIFLIQAANDHSLGPSQTLGAALARKGGRNRVRVYPAFGASTEAGHGAFACQGMEVWGGDVLRFVDEATTHQSAVAANPIERAG